MTDAQEDEMAEWPASTTTTQPSHPLGKRECNMVCNILSPRISVLLTPAADFTKGLKPRFGLKFKTLVLNVVNRMLSLWS